MKAHVCIGGPLDGEHATSEDFYGYRRNEKDAYGNRTWKRDPGMYQHLKHDYCQFNTGSHGAAKSNVVWIHRDLLTGSISPRQR
jgi:hypothetical protein